MKRTIVYASMALAAGLAMANTYNSIVDTPAWGSNIPVTIGNMRNYFQYSNPGDFYRIFSPLNQLLALVIVLLFWRSNKRSRWFFVSAFLLYATAEAMTFAYFYPRNDIMLRSPLTEVEKIKAAWEQWRAMNWVRSLVIAVGFVCSAIALHFSYASTKATIEKVGKVRRSKAAEFVN